jgi:hypothetical protein
MNQAHKYLLRRKLELGEEVLVQVNMVSKRLK